MSNIDPEVFLALASASEAAYTESNVSGYTLVDSYDDLTTGFSFTIYKSVIAEEYIFAFRGTQLSAQDIYTDLNAGMKQWTEENRSEVLEKIRERTNGKEDAVVHFTGHSLGGALAQFAAYEYAVASMSNEDPGEPFAPFDLVTFNALGSVLALSDPDLYSETYDPLLAETINAAHFKIKTDVVSKLGSDHVGGELLVIDRPTDSPLDAHGIDNFTGIDGNDAVTALEYANAVPEDNYLDITQLISVSGILASFGDDGLFSGEEALLRSISAFSFGLAGGNSADLSELVVSIFGEPSTIGQEKFDAWVLLGEKSIQALQYSQLGLYGKFVGAYSLVLANVLQESAQAWEQYPAIADAIGLSIDVYIDNMMKPGLVIAESALAFALETEFLAQDYQDVVDYIGNTVEWVQKYFAAQPLNEMYIEGGGGDDFLSGNDAYWDGKNPDDHIFGYAGDDTLEGGEGTDFLFGGTGTDKYYWSTGDGNDFIGDYDDAGDRVFVNGIDLATLEFERTSPASPYFIDRSRPDITVHYEGDVLKIDIGDGPGAGSITITQYTPAAGQDHGIVLNDYGVTAAQVTDFTVASIGDSDLESDNEIRANAYDRIFFSQRGLDWETISISFDAGTVDNYSGGSLHGTLDGAFEGGPLGDYLIGDEQANALHGLANDDHIEGKGGDDLLEGGAGSDQLLGGDGSDLVFGSARAGLAIDLDPGSPYGQFYLSQISDAPGDINILDGGDGDDGLSGGEYTDYIDGGSGADYLLGGTGADYISGGPDRDIVYGDSTFHYSYVEAEPGVLFEQLEIAFAEGEDSIGHYDDVIHAGEGHDTVWGELGDDELHGHDGADNLVGDRYNDPAYFGAEFPAYGDSSPDLDGDLHGNDRLFGGSGADLLLGLGGDDFLAGGPDADTMLGGAGDDTYFFEPGDGLDYVEDTEGTHTLLFTDMALADMHVLFQGEQVFVGTGYGSEGFYLSGEQWASVIIAQDTPDAVFERSRLDTLYLDAAGNLLLTVHGNDEISEADRDALFTVDNADPDQPRIVVGAGVDEVEIEASPEAEGGATMRILGGGFQFIVDLLALQLETGFDFLSLADGVSLGLIGFSGDIFGSEGADRIIGGSEPDHIHGGAGADVIEGRGADDELEGGSGEDVLRGGEGDDILDDSPWSDRDYLEGGSGNDILKGGRGLDTYAFAPGDGQDLLIDPEGGHNLEFDETVIPGSVVLYYTAATSSHFRLEYGAGDAVVSQGGASSHWIESVTVGATAIPLVQRSDLEDGTFRDTRGYDVFEPGPGSDTIYMSGWSAEDAVRLSPGDGQDTIMAEDLFYPAYIGELRLGADVDPASLSFSFGNGSATINYATDDQVILAPGTLFSFRDNVFSRFSLVSEADPGWNPVIRAEGYVGNLYGSYGSDLIIGNANIETIIPGYGEDIVEAGDGPDWIVLNDVYMQSGGGIGQKDISGQGDNDTIETPMHQGITIHYDRGDGDDTIAYDWTYSSLHPYRMSVDVQNNVMQLDPYGQDVLAFGPGISLADLRFVRSQDTLTISLLDYSGSIRLEDFFHAYQFDPSAWTGDVSEFIGQEGDAAPDTLLHPAFLGGMPQTPLAALRFEDGSVYDMALVLESHLEEVEATLLGTEGDDSLFGTNDDDVIHALGGNDFISDFGGYNIILAGPGDDYVLAGSDSDIDLGPGEDGATLPYGNHIIRFAQGGGSDSVYFDVASATALVEVSAGITLEDMDFTLAETDSGEAPLITLTATGDTLLLVGTRYNLETGVTETEPDSSALSLRFADGHVITGGEIYGLAVTEQGQTITGTEGNDLLVGTQGDDVIVGGPGNDTLEGAGGDDLFLIEGRQQGRDHIIGGEGFDTISGGNGDDQIGLTGLSLADGVERIDGGLGRNTIVGTATGNTFDFSATELLGIAAIDGRDGGDQIVGSADNDVIRGGAGNDDLIGNGGKDTLSGGAGDDTYVYTWGDGRDVINNNDVDPDSVDILQLMDIAYDQVWLSRKDQHLVMSVAGTFQRVLVKNWYAGEEDQLDSIYAGDRVLMRDNVDQLVNAMAAFDIPEGVGTVIPEDVRLELEPVLASVWQQAA